MAACFAFRTSPHHIGNHINIPQGAMNTASSHVRVAWISRHVLAVDERLNALLKVGCLERELELLQRLGHQQLVAERLARLHDAHQGGVDLVLPVL
jgi:hypothetical protein